VAEPNHYCIVCADFRHNDIRFVLTFTIYCEFVFGREWFRKLLIIYHSVFDIFEFFVEDESSLHIK